MATRPTGFGMTQELGSKKSAKFDADLAGEAFIWMSSITGESLPKPFSEKDVQDALKDGVALCKLANAIKPGSVAEIASSKMAFKMKENIGNFLSFCEKIGLVRIDLFQTVDLFEGQNIPQVIDTVFALGRKAQKVNPSLPRLGPKEADENPGSFTEDQLRSGEGVIGLQAGSNKGASTAGLNFGKTRAIID